MNTYGTINWIPSLFLAYPRDARPSHNRCPLRDVAVPLRVFGAARVGPPRLSDRPVGAREERHEEQGACNDYPRRPLGPSMHFLSYAQL